MAGKSIRHNRRRRAKRRAGRVRADQDDLPEILTRRHPRAFRFRDNGETPNNPHLPLLVYRAAVDFPQELDPAAVLEVLFASNGWRRSWRNGVYPFRHFHTRTHEVLGIARGRARVEFGGDRGRVLALARGDVVVLPAGTGHKRRSASRNLLVVGAYPESGAYDEPKPGEVDHAKALALIARVKMPARDPVYGRHGPLTRLWAR
jgi:uncharacterized protein YjlB